MMNSLPKTNGQTNSYSLRIFLLLAGITAFILLIILRLFNLQVVHYQYYRVLAADQHEFEKTILPTRGEIYLSSVLNQQPLLVATNITKNLVFVVPKDVTEPGKTVSILAPILEMDREVLLQKITSDSNYVPLKKQLTDEVSNQIKELNLAGINLEPENIRYYPEKSLASHVLGFLGYKGNLRVGQYGIEGRFDQNLAGSKGVMGTEKDIAGRWITVATRNLTPAMDGDDVYLTIDSAIQNKAEQVLKTTVETHSAERGTVIVANPKTGAIIALANYPSFDLNEYNKVEDAATYSNTTLTSGYEPGSVFKPITMAAAIDNGAVNPETTYEDTGVVELDDFKIKNSDGQAYGVQNMTQVLERSLNTGMVFVEKELGHNDFKKYVEKFGFGKVTGIELPNESLGNLDNLQKKGDIFFATSSFGQGLSVTPVQLIQAYTALANGGKMMKPYIVDKVVHADGSEQKTFEHKVGQVIDSKTAAQISAMLVNVVENGHGKRAAVPGYYIAGKTGTAQVSYQDRVGYDPNKSIGSFVGYGPVDNPAFLMLVRIDNPKDVKFAESTAAPAFGEIAKFILNYFQVSPSR